RAGSAPAGAGGDRAGSWVSHEGPPWWSWSRRAAIQSASFRSAGTPIMGGDDEGSQGETSDAVWLRLLESAPRRRVSRRINAVELGYDPSSLLFSPQLSEPLAAALCAGERAKGGRHGLDRGPGD